MKKTIVLLTILIFSWDLAQATIRIISTSPATASCNGGIYVEATGTAGPFSLKITNASGFLLERAMSSPTESITGLCSGEYTVQVFNAFGCAKTLLAQVGASSASLDGLPQRRDALRIESASHLLRARAFPNPFSSAFQVEVQWDGLQTETIQVEIRNALGQLIQTQAQVMVLGRNVFNVQLSDVASRGFLQVLLRDKKGGQVVLKVMQVRE